ncbi:MAG: peptidylprolyl isomerase [Verrucomicrobia bacterium]|nr:peptidylprolyl isomerase [Verrucomicrobiota bacterium]
MRSVFFALVLLTKLGFSEHTALIMETTEGEMELLLFPDVAPQACDNFLRLVDKGFYNGLLFHRIIKGYMIQSGDPTGTGRESISTTCKPIPDEISTIYEYDMPGRVGLVSFGPDRNGSQFFITFTATPWLTGKHTLFGQVIRGFKTLQALENSSEIPKITRIRRKYETLASDTDTGCSDTPSTGAQ